MLWSIGQVGRQAKVTSRTLRHYDSIGLLSPTATGPSGRRYYGEQELLRLQQILLLRELGLPLDAVGRILSADGQMTSVTLRQHHRWLLKERDRLDQLAATVAETIAKLDKGESMSPDTMFDGFEGFDAARQERYEAEIAEKCGEDAVLESRRKAALLGPEGIRDVADGFVDVERELTALLVDGVPADDLRVLAVLGDHHALVSKFWMPDAESYAGLADMYVEHPDFRARYDALDPRLAEYLRDGMIAYGVARLSVAKHAAPGY